MAQPITKWQAFRQYYATSNPGSNIQAVSIAWREYKEQHGITTKPTNNTNVEVVPMVKNVSGVIQLTLLGLPLDLVRYLMPFLASQSIARLHRTCKQTKEWTKARLEVLYHSLPTHKEVSFFLQNRMVLPYRTSVELLSKRTEQDWRTTLTLHNGQLALTLMNQKHVKVRSNYLENNEHVWIDPTTMLAVMYSRKNVTEDRGEYGMSVIREYIQNILMPWLPTVSEDEDIVTLSNTEQKRIKPVPTGEEREVYVEAVKQLITINAWMCNANFSVPNQDLMNLVQRILSSIGDLVAVIPNRSLSLCHCMEVTTTSVLEYIRHQLVRKPIKMAFLSTVDAPNPDNEKQEGFYIKVSMLDMTDMNTGTYTEYILRGDETTTYPQDGAKVLANMLKTKQLPGVVDPHTIKMMFRDVVIPTSLQHWLWDTLGHACNNFGILLGMDSDNIARTLRRQSINTKTMFSFVLYELWCSKNTKMWEETRREQIIGKTTIMTAAVVGILYMHKKL